MAIITTIFMPVTFFSASTCTFLSWLALHAHVSYRAILVVPQHMHGWFSTKYFAQFHPTFLGFWYAKNVELLAGNARKTRVVLPHLRSYGRRIIKIKNKELKEMLWVDKHKPKQLSQLDYHPRLTEQLQKLVQSPPTLKMPGLRGRGRVGTGRRD